jgi:uncharacterized Zn finger protein
VTGARRAPSRRDFGRTWWGRAWTHALEERARLDPNRLPRGRTYARKGRVGALTVSPGLVRAAVQGSRVTPYLVQVRVRPFGDDEWERVLDAVAARAGHTAALLDGELPPEVVEDASSAGVSLLPGPGEVGPRCSCPDWADPCKHSAAVVYLVAEVLDRDPFALLLLRGRTREEILAGLRRRRAGDAPGVVDMPAERAADLGEVARSAFAAVERPPLPSVPLPPRHPAAPVPLAVDPPTASGLRRHDLATLAADAAGRAWDLCLGEGDGSLTLPRPLDLARRAAALLGLPGRLEDVAARSGVSRRDLGRRAMAWRLGGADAVSALDETWSGDPEAMAEGRAALRATGVGRLDVRHNRITAGSVQLRLTRTGAWYRFERAGGAWELVDGPCPDPATAASVGSERKERPWTFA